jgi:hypothetical protein
MGYRAASLNFSKGWISRELESRFDLSIYSAGLREATNVKIKRTGGVSKRMGTRFVAECPSEGRLLAFQFSDDQAYALLHYQATMQPLALGGAVLEEGLLVTAITKAVHAQITAAYHGYSVGDPVYLSGITGMVEINDRFLTVLSVPDANNITVDFDSTSAGVFTGSGGGTARVGPPPAPPAPPVVPDPLPAPDPPTVGGGGGGGYDDGGTWRGGGGINPNEPIP